MKRRAYTLIELLIVMIILSMILAIALPAYFEAYADAKVKAANSNTKTLVTSFQHAYVKGGGTSYAAIDPELVRSEMNGWPSNPCYSTRGADGWSMTRQQNGMMVVPKNDQGCGALLGMILGEMRP